MKRLVPSLRSQNIKHDIKYQSETKSKFAIYKVSRLEDVNNLLTQETVHSKLVKILMRGDDI